jgi:hypothetical protein
MLTFTAHARLATSHRPAFSRAKQPTQQGNFAKRTALSLTLTPLSNVSSPSLDENQPPPRAHHSFFGKRRNLIGDCDFHPKNETSN